MVLMIVVVAKLASRGRPATGPVRHAEVDDDDLGSWRRSSMSDTATYSALGAVAASEAFEDRDGDGQDDRDQGGGGDDGGSWDSSDSSSDSSDSGGDSSSD